MAPHEPFRLTGVEAAGPQAQAVIAARFDLNLFSIS
jgi:hypothetical protein